MMGDMWSASKRGCSKLFCILESNLMLSSGSLSGISAVLLHIYK